MPKGNSRTSVLVINLDTDSEGVKLFVDFEGLGSLHWHGNFPRAFLEFTSLGGECTQAQPRRRAQPSQLQVPRSCSLLSLEYPVLEAPSFPPHAARKLFGERSKPHKTAEHLPGERIKHFSQISSLRKVTLNDRSTVDESDWIWCALQARMPTSTGRNLGPMRC